jgi:hypothetical protein
MGPLAADSPVLAGAAASASASGIASSAFDPAAAVRLARALARACNTLTNTALEHSCFALGLRGHLIAEPRRGHAPMRTSSARDKRPIDASRAAIQSCCVHPAPDRAGQVHVAQMEHKIAALAAAEDPLSMRLGRQSRVAEICWLKSVG